jgi:hypothetical protein
MKRRIYIKTKCFYCNGKGYRGEFGTSPNIKGTIYNRVACSKCSGQGYIETDQFIFAEDIKFK